MLSKKTLLTASNLNNAFISKSDTNSQSINSNLTISGGALTLKNSVLTDNANTGYLRIDPQGNNVIIYDGVNNQRLDVFSSSGSESAYITTINGTPSYSLIDVSSSVDHLEINTNSSKYTLFGGDVRTNGVLQTQNPTNTSAVAYLGWYNNDPRIRIGGTGSGSAGTFRIQGTSDVDRLTVDSTGNTWTKGTLTASGKITASGGIGIYSSNTLSFDTYGGGFNMTDTTWIRTTGSKSFYQNAGTMRTDGTFQVGNNGATLNVPTNGQFNYMNGKFTIATGGAIGTTGPLNMTTSMSADSGIKIDGVSIDNVGSTGNLAIRSLNQLRFGDSNSWDYNTWGGIKYNSTTLKMYIGGPASTQFSSNANPANIDISFTGVGHVGVGTDTPVEMLDVAGNIKLRNGDSIYIGNNADSGDRLRLHHNNSEAYIDFGSGNLHIRNTTPNDVLTLLSGGNVGIGTTSPLKLLDVKGDARISGNIYSGISSLGFLNDAGGALPVKMASLAVTSSYSNSAPSYGLYVQGSAGVGTTTPTKKLDVVGDIRVQDNIYSPSLLNVYTDTGTAQSMKVGSLVVSSSYSNSAPSNGLYVEGNVGLGMTPAYRLDVAGVIGADSTIISRSNGDVFQAIGTGNGVKTIRWDNSNLRFWNSTALDLMTLTTGGRIGIGNSAPAYKLDVSGDVNVTGVIYSPGNNTKSIQVGDESSLWDINVANTMGLYGVANTAVGALKLGSTGPTLYGSGGSLGIATTTPNSTYKIDANGIINATNLYYSGQDTDVRYLKAGAKAVDSDKLDNLDSSQFIRSDIDAIIAGNHEFYATDTSGAYNTSAIEIREVNNVTTTQSSNAYAPALAFHWGGRVQGQLALDSSGVFNLRDGSTFAVNKTLNAGNLQVVGNNVWHAGNDSTLVKTTGVNKMTGDLNFTYNTGIDVEGVNAIKLLGPTVNGYGVKVGAGGLTVVGAGESADVFVDGFLAASTGNTAGTEQLYLTSDNSVFIRTGMNSATNSTYATTGKTFEFDSAGSINVGGVEKLLFSTNGDVRMNTDQGGRWYIMNAGDISSLTSTSHGFQIGVDSGISMRFDNNEIQVANNGASANLSLNPFGGTVTVNGYTVATVNDTIKWGTATPTGGSDGDIYIQY
jgi:hypothetical protein